MDLNPHPTDSWESKECWNQCSLTRLKQLPVSFSVQEASKTKGRQPTWDMLRDYNPHSEDIQKAEMWEKKKGVTRISLENRQYCPSRSLPAPHPDPHVGRVKGSFFLT